MITEKQIKKLNAYAAGSDVRVAIEGSYVCVYKGEDFYIRLSNKTSSALSLKSVKYHIDNCSEYGQG